MFGKRITTTNSYLQKKLKGNKEDNILLKTGKNSITTLTKQSTPSNSYTNTTSNTKIFLTKNGITDNTGTLLTYNKNEPLLKEHLILHLEGNISEPSIVSDLSGNGLHGTFSGTLESNEQQYDDNYGEVFDFDGTDDYIILPTIAGSLFNNKNEFTFSCWIYPKTASDDYFFDITTNTNSNRILFRLNSFKLNLYLFTNTDSIIINNISSNSDIILNIWSHVSITLSKNNSNQYILKFYINGILDKIYTSSTTDYNFYDYDRTNNYISRYNNGSSGFFKGKMFDYRMYSYNLSSEEISQVYYESLTQHSKIIQQPNLDKQLEKHLFLWIKGDEETIDKINNYGNNEIILTPNNSPLIIRGYKRDLPAIEFDGTNDYIDVSTISGNSFSNGFTFTGWIKAIQSPSADKRIFQFGTSNPDDNGIILMINNYNIKVSIKNNSSDVYQKTTTANIDSNWNHICWSDNASSMYNIYINGILLYTDTYTGTFPNINRGTNNIGAKPNSTVDNFNGQMSDLRYYSRVLSQSEIKTLYQQSFEKYHKPHTNQLLSQFSSQNQITSTAITNNIANFNSPHTNKLVLHLAAKEIATYPDSITDYSGNAHQGYPYNISRETSKLAITGSSSALSFNGTSSYIECSGVTPYDYILSGLTLKDNLTFSGWIYINNLSTNQVLITFDSLFEDNALLNIYINTSGKLIIEIQDWIYTYSTIFSATTWYYISIKRNLNNGKVVALSKQWSTYYATKTDTIITENKLEDWTFYDLDNDSSLFLHLPMDNITNGYVRDLSGNNFNGTINNGSDGSIRINNIGPYGGQCLDLDGSNDYLELPTINESYFTNGFTFSGWINVSSTTNYRMFLYLGENDNADLGFDIYMQYGENGVLQIVINGSTINSITININTWYHITFTSNNDSSNTATGKIYINGILNNTKTNMNTISTTNGFTNNYIGVYKGNTEYLSGLIFDYRLYSRVLSSTEIKNLYSSYSNIKIPNELFLWINVKHNNYLSITDVTNNFRIQNNGVTIQSSNIIDFDGTNDYLFLSRIPGSYFENSITFTGWINYNSVNNWKRIFTTSSNSSSPNQDGIRLLKTDTDILRLVLGNSSGTTITFNFTNYEITFNEWIHIGLNIIYNGSTTYTCNLYINGTFIQSISQSFISNYNYAVLRSVLNVGRELAVTGYFDGQMYDLRFYSRALFNDEIDSIYNSTKNFSGSTDYLNSKSNYLRVGRSITTNASTTSTYFNGYMDDIRLYKRSLTIQELEYIWNSGSGSYTNGSNLLNSALVQYTSGSNLILNSRVLNKVSDELVYDSNRKQTDDSLFLWIRGDEGTGSVAYDYSGNGLNGTIINTTFTELSLENKYKLTKCLDFDGVSDYIALPSISSSYFSNGFTFCGWVNYNSLTNYQRIFDFNSGFNANNRLILDISSNKYRLVLTNSSGSAFLIKTSSFTITANIYNFVSLSLYYNNNTYYIKIYVNGILDLYDTISNIYDFSIYNRDICYIGRKTEEDQDYINGQMTDLRWYSRILSADEIRKQYLDKVTSGFLLNESKTDIHSLRIMDNNHTTSTALSRISGILEPTIYNLDLTEDKLSASVWVYPEYQQNGTIISNSKGSSSLASGDWVFGIEPIRYDDMFLWITGNDIDISETSTSSVLSSIYNSAKTSITVAPINSPTSSTGPFRNNVINFDGSNDYLSISTIPGSYLSNGITFSGWIKIIDNDDNDRRIFEFNDSSSNESNRITIKINSLRPHFFMHDDNNTNIIDLKVNDAFELNKYYHLSFTLNYDSSTNYYECKSYVNGIFNSSYNYTTTYDYSSLSRTNNFIGAKAYLSSDWFDGQMFDLRFYSTPLSTDEIKQIYNRTQHLVFKYYNGSDYQLQVSKIHINLKEWTHLAVNYSKPDNTIELYQNNNIGFTKTITNLPSLNTSSIIIGAQQYSNTNRNIFQGELCDLIIKPEITYIETLQSIYNMENKLVLDLQVRDTPYDIEIITQLNNTLVYDASNYIGYNIQDRTENLLNHRVNSINISSIKQYYQGFSNVLQFNGSNDYIELSGYLSLNPIYNFNISFWIYPDSTKNSGNGYIISKWDSSISNYFFIVYYDYDNDNLRFQYRTFQGNTISTGFILSQDTWSYISINFINKEGYYIYVNGELQEVKLDNREINNGRYTLNGSTLYNSEKVFIGKQSNNNNYYQGYLKNIQVYNSVLTPRTIKYNYNKSKVITNTQVNTSQFTPSQNYLKQQPILDISSNIILNIDANTINNISSINNSLLNNYISDNSPNNKKINVNSNANVFIQSGITNSSTTSSSLYLDNTPDAEAYLFTNEPLNIDTSNFSISTWIKYDTSTPSYQYIFRNGNSSLGYGLQLNNNELEFSNTSTNSSNIAFSPELTLSTGAWYNIIYINDSGTSTIYINGESKTLTNTTPNLDVPTSLFSIGSVITESIGSTSYTRTVNHNLTGYIQDFKVFNKVLSSDEIYTLSINNSQSHTLYNQEIIEINSNTTYTNAKKYAYVSKYSTDNKNNLDSVLPIIARDNVLVHYNPDNYPGSGTTLPDINHNHKSKYLYNNSAFTDKYHGAITYDATLTNAIISTDSGYINKDSIYFNGTSSYLTVASGANLNTNSGNEWTISCWVKPDNLRKNTDNVIWCKTNNGSYTTGAVRLTFESSSNTLKLEISGGSSYDTYINIIENEWTLLTTTFGRKGYTSNILTQYINNVQVYRAINNSISISSPSSSDVIIFGSDTTSSNLNYSGYMDNIQIWNTRLLDGEIERLYNKSITSGPLTHIIPENIINIDNTIIQDLGFSNSKLKLVNATLSTSITNINNNSIYFNGSSAYGKINSLSIMKDNPRTISLWFYTTTTNTQQTLYDIGSSSSGNKFKISINSSNKIEINLGTTVITSIDIVSDNTWYHLCVIVLPRTFHSSNNQGTDKNIRIFLNGKHTTDKTTYDNTIINTQLSSPTVNTFGQFIGATTEITNLFSGYLDDIRIYKQALSFDEILNLFENSHNYKLLEL